MSFADPTSFTSGATITPSGGTAISCAVLDRSAPYTGVYGSTDGLTKLKISHSLGSRKRSEVRVDLVTTYTDPSTGLAKDITASCYLVINRPNAGFTNVQLKAIMAGIAALTGVSANQDKILALES